MKRRTLNKIKDSELKGYSVESNEYDPPLEVDVLETSPRSLQECIIDSFKNLKRWFKC